MSGEAPIKLTVVSNRKRGPVSAVVLRDEAGKTYQHNPNGRCVLRVDEKAMGIPAEIDPGFPPLDCINAFSCARCSNPCEQLDPELVPAAEP